MPTLPNMGLVLPTPGGDSGTWDDKINAALSLVDAHDHTSGKGTRVPSAGIDINADLSFDSFTILDVGKYHFAGIAAPSSGSFYLFVNIADSELYWRTTGGVNVKLTNGTSLNTSLLGGIVGDYASVGAEVAFDDANDRYTFKQQGGSKPWARLASGEVRILETGTTETVYVGLAAPAALGGSYTITLPTAVPAGSSYVLMSASGVLSTTTKARTLIIGAALAVDPNGSHNDNDGAVWSLNASVNPLIYPISGNVGDVITNISARVNKTSDATNTLTLELVDTATGVGNWGAGIATFIATNVANNPGQITMTPSAPTTHTLVAGRSYAVRFLQSDATPSGTDSIGPVEVTFQ